MTNLTDRNDDGICVLFEGTRRECAYQLADSTNLDKWSLPDLYILEALATICSMTSVNSCEQDEGSDESRPVVLEDFDEAWESLLEDSEYTDEDGRVWRLHFDCDKLLMVREDYEFGCIESEAW